MEVTLYPGETGFLRMRRLMESLEEAYGPWDFEVVHVAGTSGKGSTALMTARLLEGAGLKVGLFVSPYLISPEEQMQVNGKYISAREDARARDAVNKCATTSVRPEFGLYSNFEKLAARALMHFQKKKVAVVVLETGMGGMYDATNAVKSDIAVITPVSHDHERLLGPDIEDIARHKAGIIKSGNRAVIIGRQQPKVAATLDQAARRSVGPPLFLGADFSVNNVQINESGTTFDYHHGAVQLSKIHLSLTGRHQADNAALAITAARMLVQSTSTACLSKLRHPGRFDILKHKNKKIIMDVAHNPEKIAAVVSTFKELWPGEEPAVVFSCKWTKDVRLMARTLHAIAHTVVLTHYVPFSDNLVNRVMGKPQLVAAFEEAGFEKILWEDRPAGALQKALIGSTKFIIATGSFHLLRELYER